MSSKQQTKNRNSGLRTQDSGLVVIVGFMGAGKTIVADALAARLNCRAIDLDEHIKTLFGRTPQQIIDADGERAFRDAETEALRDALRLIPTRNYFNGTFQARARNSFSEAPLVLALGGGAWTIERNRELVNARGALTIWLDAPFELCWRRIVRTSAAQPRPFAREEAAARKRFEERLPLYRLAQLRVRVEEESRVEEIVRHIIRALN